MSRSKTARARIDATLSQDALRALRQLQTRVRREVCRNGGSLHAASVGRILDILILQERARVAALEAQLREQK